MQRSMKKGFFQQTAEEDNRNEACREKILSEDYMDLIIGEEGIPLAVQKGSPQGGGQMIFGGDSDFGEQDPDACIQTVDSSFRILHLKRADLRDLSSADYFYSNIPLLYVPLSTTALDAAGITQAAQNPVLDLQGQGVILAFADTGIDYRHPAFLQKDGKTRILEIWDQTIQSGQGPEGIDYGTVFSREDINEALTLENPLERVPSQDENGHGTFVAGTAGGSSVIWRGERYQGAAPQADLVMVKLKPAKSYLKEYYRVPSQALVYQENDIMQAMRYFQQLEKRWNRPVVICFALGTNQGGHNGATPLGQMMRRISREFQMAVVAAAGNEAARSHHYYGRAVSREIGDTVELQIAEGEQGFTMEIWPDESELVTISLTSPSGQRTEKFVTRLGVGSRILFLLEGTVVTVNFWFHASGDGTQIITICFDRPAPGLWKVQVYSVLNYGGGFHIWLPVEGLILPDTIFLRPDIDVTLTDPSNEEHLITVGAYDPVTGAIYLQSGRGNTRTGKQQPTLAAPGVAVGGPTAGRAGAYESWTGTSAAAALAAGAAASLYTWGIVNGNLRVMTGTTVKFFLIIGAIRQNSFTYPNKEWGYGTLNLYHFFEVLREL